MKPYGDTFKTFNTFKITNESIRVNELQYRDQNFSRIWNLIYRLLVGCNVITVPWALCLPNVFFVAVRDIACLLWCSFYMMYEINLAPFARSSQQNTPQLKTCTFLLLSRRTPSSIWMNCNGYDFSDETLCYKVQWNYFVFCLRRRPIAKSSHDYLWRLCLIPCLLLLFYAMLLFLICRYSEFIRYTKANFHVYSSIENIAYTLSDIFLVRVWQDDTECWF